MAYSCAKAEDHIKTGKFNIKASPNNTLVDYGNHFANRLGVGHARQLLVEITYELIARDRGTSSSRYNLALSPYEKSVVNRYSKLVNITSPFAPKEPYLVRLAKGVTFDEAKVSAMLLELEAEYNNLGVAKFAALPVKEIQSFYNTVTSNTLTSEQSGALAVTIISCVLLLNTVCTKAGFSLDGSTEGFHNGNLILKIKGAVCSGKINMSSLLEALTSSSLKVVAEGGPSELMDLNFLPASNLTVDGKDYKPTSFKDIYKILKTI